MNKISLNVHVPAVGRKHDFLVPEMMSISKIISLMVNILSEEYPGIRIDSKQLSLMDMRSNKVMQQACTCKQLGVINGSKLMLL
ncbi:hypothetical protein [Paenibacillus andongensis]|uniref:hypothetical protein n=1 Tax=Paenibacillus andongensis TaxID=2975482 RepID=UPI0021BACE57|nr:hypothetical protein [Paenibacillus andongensis]